MPRRIEIVEVGPRDGLQNEKALLEVDQKLECIGRLEAAGARRIETVSFVNPKRVPQMAAAEQTAAMQAIAARQKAEGGPPITMTVSVAFGCPFDGEVSEEQVMRIVRAAAPGIPLRMHFHDTRNTGLANAAASVEAGVDVLDASCGGLGGCPFAPDATGNIGTEDLVYMLERAGYATGYDLEKLITTAQWMAGILGKPPAASVSRAGVFPLRG